jgi:hypothetical protein
MHYANVENRNRTEQDFYWFEMHIHVQRIVTKTKYLLNPIKLHMIYMFETHASLTTFGIRGWYILNMI